jgi:hypothetical protein
MGAKAAELSDATGPVGGIVARATVATVFGPYTQLEAGFPLATALQSGPTPLLSTGKRIRCASANFPTDHCNSMRIRPRSWGWRHGAELHSGDA